MSGKVLSAWKQKKRESSAYLRLQGIFWKSFIPESLIWIDWIPPSIKEGKDSEALVATACEETLCFGVQIWFSSVMQMRRGTRWFLPGSSYVHLSVGVWPAVEGSLCCTCKREITYPDFKHYQWEESRSSIYQCRTAGVGWRETGNGWLREYTCDYSGYFWSNVMLLIGAHLPILLRRAAFQTNKQTNQKSFSFHQ